MPIPLGYSSLTPSTPFNLELDAALIVLNLNKALLESSGSITQAMAPSATFTYAFTGQVVTPTLLGASRDAQIVNPGITEREIDFNGRRTNVAGLSRRDMIAPYAEVTLLEMGGAAQAQLALGSGSVSTTAGGHVKIQPSFIINNTDYYANVAIIVATSHSSGLPVVHLLENVRVMSPENEEFRDHNEATQRVRLNAHSLASDNFGRTVPYYKYVPQSVYGS